MRLSGGSVALLVLGGAGVALSLYYTRTSPEGTALGAAIAVAAGLALVLERVVRELPAPPPDMMEAARPEAGAGTLGGLDRDAFARRRMYEQVANLTSRSLGPNRWDRTGRDSEAICRAPTPTFRAWVREHLDELEAET